MILAAFSFATCGSDDSDENGTIDPNLQQPTATTRLTLENAPIMDGSDSTEPLRTLLMCRLLGIECVWLQWLHTDGTWGVTPVWSKLSDDAKTALQQILCNRNTHGSFISLIDGEILDAIIDKCAECNCVLLLDECFKPLTCADRKNRSGKGTVLHLRAFTKTFAIPGIRLGYMISGDTDILEEIRIHLPEWNISQIADKAGKAACDMLMHTDFLAESADLSSMERSYLKKELTDLGLKVYPSDVNYLLIRYKSGLYEKLLKYGILIRRCENFRGLDDTYFRIAVRKHEENEVLVDTLRNIINTGE